MSKHEHPDLDVSQLVIHHRDKVKSRDYQSWIINVSIVISLILSSVFLGVYSLFPSSTGASHRSDLLENEPLSSPALQQLHLNSIQREEEQGLGRLGLSVAQEKVLDASGHIVARRVATVSSRVTGTLTKLHVEEGQSVQEGQVLAELNEHKADIFYQLAKAELSSKRSALEEFQSLLNQHNKTLERNKVLAAKQLISIQQLENSVFKHEQLSMQIKNKMAVVELAKHRLALADYELSQHKIRAPFSGVVVSKNAQEGELISAGSSAGGFIRTGVATIVDMSSLEVEVEVSESYIHLISVAQKALVKLDAYPQWSIPSEVTAIIPTANRDKASIKVRIKLSDFDSRVLPDMGVKVSFIKLKNESENVVLLSDSH
ncbi:efflux RND transporter periplasmic adaptor subunit [Agaribacterium sp. ZY112]|uniref:efflux RND transporter periplasmic adaptor subunit n=1 Tax=Agaribacterium sp. ZY112 TaxID=3233574 RepID=UPI003523AD4B